MARGMVCSSSKNMDKSIILNMICLKTVTFLKLSMNNFTSIDSPICNGPMILTPENLTTEYIIRMKNIKKKPSILGKHQTSGSEN